MLRFADDDFFNIVYMLAVRIPEMAIVLLGIMLSLASWRRYPRPALLSFLAFALLLLLILVGEPITFLMQMYNLLLREVFFAIAEIVRSFVAAGAYLLLVFAIYAGRRPPAPRRPVNDNEELPMKPTDLNKEDQPS